MLAVTLALMAIALAVMGLAGASRPQNTGLIQLILLFATLALWGISTALEKREEAPRGDGP